MKPPSANCLALLAATALAQLSSPAALAATPAFTLDPSACTPVCGASKAGQDFWLQPDVFLLEENSVEVDVDFGELLDEGDENIFISTVSDDQAFTPSGQFTANANGGGIGIVLGSARPPHHPACAGADGDNRQFGLYAFSWGDPYGPTPGMVSCKNISKERLRIINGKVRIAIATACDASPQPLCSATATLREAATDKLLAMVAADGIRLQNPTIARLIWYGVSNYYADSPNHPVTFEPRSERYSFSVP